MFFSKRSFVASLLILALCIAANVQGQSPATAKRVWGDKSGKFTVEATVISVAGGKVKLLKTDGLAIEVPLISLSDADQLFLKDWTAAHPEENPFAGGTPMVVSGASGATGPSAATDLLAPNAAVDELPTDGVEIFINVSETPTPIQSDPLPYQFQFKEFSRPLEKIDAYARVSAPIVIDPAAAILAVSVHRNGNAVEPTTFGSVYLAGPAQKRSVQVLDVNQTLLLLDHHVSSGRSLAVLGVDSPSDRGGDLVLLDKLASGSPTAMHRWHLPEWQKPGFAPKVEFARQLDGERAIVRVNNSVHCWSLTTGKSLWRIDRVSGKLDVSGGGKYLAVAIGGGCHVIDVEQASLISTLSFPSSLTPEIQFSPKGDKLALVAGNQYVVWDLTQAEIVHEATMATASGKFFGWVSNDAFLTQLAGLVDLSLGRNVWKYSLPSGGEARTVSGGVSAVDKIDIATLYCLPVPHPPVTGALKKLGRVDDSMMLLKPGSMVSLSIDAEEGIDKDAMLKALQSAVERAGWKVHPSAETKIIATILRGDEQELRFRSIGFPRTGSGEVVKMRPYKTSLEIVRGDQTIWSQSSRNMVPFVLHLQSGESIAEAVKKYEVADPTYFERVTIPPRILKPEVDKQIGTSRVKNGRWDEN